MEFSGLYVPIYQQKLSCIAENIELVTN